MNLVEHYITPFQQEKPEAERQTFTLQPLTKRLYWEWTTEVAKQKGLPSIQAEELLLINGVKSWHNVKNEAGEPVEFKKDVDYILDHISVGDIKMIIQKVAEISVLTDLKVKN